MQQGFQNVIVQKRVMTVISKVNYKIIQEMHLIKNVLIVIVVVIIVLNCDIVGFIHQPKQRKKKRKNKRKQKRKKLN